MNILNKLVNNSTIKHSAILDQSELFEHKDVIPTDVPMINVALSGQLDGGITPGLTMIAGPSKHYKTAFSLLLGSAYMKKYPQSVMLFYDSEFGTPQHYFDRFSIDKSRVVHTPITDIEQLKHDILNQLQMITREDKVFIVIDSIGNLASKKEIDDAIEGKTVADMSRAKQIKSLFRIVTPHLSLKDIPMVVVNHTYKEIGLYPKDIVGGGTGSYYSSDNIWIVGRSQEKEGTTVIGYNFNIVIEKSRYCKEKSKIPILVTYDGGISKFSGLFDIALEGKFITEVSKGWYTIGDDKKVRKDAIENDNEFWQKMIEPQSEFAKYVQQRFKL